MTDFNKTTNFTAKDALTTGDPNKVIKGSDHDTEYDNIATSSSTKANKVISGSTNNVITQTSGGDLLDAGYSFSGLVGDTAVTKAEIDLLDGCTSTTAELNILDGVTATAAEINHLDGIIPTVTELNYVNGVTSAIQTQIDTKAPLASPTFTGTPVLPTSTTGVTQSADDNSTKLATTEYVDTADAIPASGTWVEIDTDTFAATSAHLDGMDNTLYSSYIIESHGVGRSGSGGTLYVQYKIGGVAQGQQTVGLITTSGSTHDRTEFFNDSSVNGSGGYFTITIGGVGTYSTANLASTVSGFYLYNNASGPFITGGYIRLLGLKK